jgi:hypothetical protein
MSKVPTTDKHRIEYLVLRRFPNAGSPKLPVSIGSSARYAPPDNRKLRADVEAYKSELSKLPQGDLAALYTAERNKESEQQRLKAEADERALHFNQPYANADYDHWSRATHWSLDEAIALSFGKAPERVGWENVKSLVHVSPFAFQYSRSRDLALRAAGSSYLIRCCPAFFSRGANARIFRFLASWRRPSQPEAFKLPTGARSMMK